jgi:geranylgeranyl diphosphate synthase, type I
MAKARASAATPASNDSTQRDATAVIFKHFLVRHKARFETHMRRRLQRAQRRFPRAGGPTLDATQALIDLCERGGKRIRPALVLAGAMCVAARPPMPLLLDAASALELLHGYFLVHDDWMDGDLVRRGGPSVHASLRRRFGNQHIGDSAAILAGDWGVAVATDWMADLPLAGTQARAALRCFAGMQLAAVVGQIRDLLADDDDVEQTYRLKTASYTVSGPLLVGAILAGASQTQQKAIGDFAVPVGVAFQLRDDLIGVFAPPEQTGKPFASDIRAGKRTLLVLECLRRASPAEARFLRRVLGDAKASRSDLLKFVRLLESTGARTQVEDRIRVLHRRGLSKLVGARLRPEGKALLASASTLLIDRGA